MKENEFEEWVDILGYENSYQVSSFGRVKSLKRMVKGKRGLRVQNERVLIPWTLGEYLAVTLCSDTHESYLIHRLVCSAFHPNPENKPQVNHKDGIKWNNYKDNVEWSTPSENIQHSLDTNLKPKGEQMSNSKLTDFIVKEIRVSKLSDYKLGQIYDVNEATINSARNRQTWKHVE